MQLGVVAAASIRRRARASAGVGQNSATLTWQAQGIDGSGDALADLGSYEIAYSQTDSGPLPPGGASTQTVANPADTSATVNGLTAGTWVFWMRSKDAGGNAGNWTRLNKVTIA